MTNAGRPVRARRVGFYHEGHEGHEEDQRGWGMRFREVQMAAKRHEEGCGRKMEGSERERGGRGERVNRK